MSHTLPVYDQMATDSGARRHLQLIEHVTGYAPPTCPWRALYQPLVQEVMSALDFEESGNLAVAIGADPPGVTVDAISAFKTALRATRNEDARLRAMKNGGPSS